MKKNFKNKINHTLLHQHNKHLVYYYSSSISISSSYSRPSQKISFREMMIPITMTKGRNKIITNFTPQFYCSQISSKVHPKIPITITPIRKKIEKIASLSIVRMNMISHIGKPRVTFINNFRNIQQTLSLFMHSQQF